MAKRMKMLCLAVITACLLPCLMSSRVLADCGKPTVTIAAQYHDGTGKVCCPSGQVVEWPDPANPGQGTLGDCPSYDLFDCWVEIKITPPHYNECDTPSAIFKCVDEEIHGWLISGECEEEECDYFEQDVFTITVKRVKLCTSGEETDVTDSYNNIYNWDWAESGAIPNPGGNP